MLQRLVVRLTLPTLTLSGLLLVVAVATGWYVHRQQQAASLLLSRSVASMRAAEELEIRTREMRTRLNQFVVTGDLHYLTVIPSMYDQVLEWLATAEQLSSGPEEQQVTSRIRDGFGRFHKRFGEIMQLARSGTIPEQLKPLVGQLIDEQVTTGVLIHAHEFLDLNQQSIQHTIPVNQQAADRVGLGLAVLGVFGSLAGLMTGFMIARRVRQSLTRLSVPVHDAAGKLNEVVGPIELSISAMNIEELNSTLESLSVKIGDVVEQLQRSQREALRAEQLAAVGQLAAGMAHELRNPLTAIKMIVQAAVEDPHAGGIFGRSLSVLYEQILRQERSIRSFLEFARPPRLEPHVFDLGRVLRDCADLMTAQAERQGIRLECRSPDDAVEVLGDSEQIRQVVVNLLVNAIEALPAGGEIVADLTNCSTDEPPTQTVIDLAASRLRPCVWAILSVVDNGPGIPEPLGQRIFEPFTSTKETGVGLGLSICRRIVEMHDGQIAARNRPTGGALFVVALPVIPPVGSSGLANTGARPQAMGQKAEN